MDNFNTLESPTQIIDYSVFISKIWDHGAYQMKTEERIKFARKFIAAFEAAGHEVEESSVTGVLGIFMKIESTEEANTKLIERLSSVQSILRLLNLIARSDESQYKQKQTLSTMAVHKIKAMEWRKNDFNQSQKVFLLKVLAELQDKYDMQYELVDLLIEEIDQSNIIQNATLQEIELLMELINRRSIHAQQKTQLIKSITDKIHSLLSTSDKHSSLKLLLTFFSHIMNTPGLESYTSSCDDLFINMMCLIEEVPIYSKVDCCRDSESMLKQMMDILGWVLVNDKIDHSKWEKQI